MRDAATGAESRGTSAQSYTDIVKGNVVLPSGEREYPLGHLKRLNNVDPQLGLQRVTAAPAASSEP